jgi:hypothetical protein
MSSLTIHEKLLNLLLKSYHNGNTLREKTIKAARLKSIGCIGQSISELKKKSEK